MKIEVTLARAHKIAERIKVHANEQMAKAQELGAAVHVTGVTTEQVERLKGQSATAMGHTKEALRYLDALALCRSVIASANESRGINVMLAKLEVANRAMVHVKAMQDLGSTQGVGVSELGSYKPLVGAESRYSSGLSVQIMEKVELDQLAQELARLKKAAFALSDRIAEANVGRVALELDEDIIEHVSGV